MNISEAREQFPKDFIEMLYEIYSPANVDKILKSYINDRKTIIRINSLITKKNEVIEELRQNKIKHSYCNLVREALILGNLQETKIIKLNCYKQGRIYMQNLSSMLPPLFLDLHEDMLILDMCAAPGSKTTQMAAMMNNNSTIIANEINGIRRQRLEYNLKKQGVKCVQVIGEDGRKVGKLYREKFDRVLLDAPCSGEGTINVRKSESYKMWNKKMISKNAKLQKQLLKSGIDALKPGGILVYSTCTISPEENEEVIDFIIKSCTNIKVMQTNFSLKNSCNGLTVYKDNIYDKNLCKSIRILPTEEMEGFFLCKLKKK